MLLSHHPPSQYCRTYKILGIRICARCTGIIMGIIIGMIVNLPSIGFSFLFLFPIPTFLNFILQERKIIPSVNILKTILTIPLGIYIFKIISFTFLDFKYGITLAVYLILIQFLSAFILFKTGDLEKLVFEYEKGIYK